MSNLYSLNAKLMWLLDRAQEIPANIETVDEDTGEVTETPNPEVDQVWREIEYMTGSLESKVENILVYEKDLRADAAAIDAEVKALTERKQKIEKKADGLHNYAETFLDGKPFSCPRAEVKWTRSESTEVDEDTFLQWATENGRQDLMTYHAEKVTPEYWTAAKTAIKKAIKNGEEVPGAIVKQNRKMTVI